MDDILMVSNDWIKTQETIEKLKQKFETKNLGEMTTFLRIQVMRNRNRKEMILH